MGAEIGADGSAESVAVQLQSLSELRLSETAFHNPGLNFQPKWILSFTRCVSGGIHVANADHIYTIQKHSANEK